MKTSRIIILALIATFGVLALSSCGGGGGGGGTPPPNPSTLQIVLSVVPDGLVGQPYSLQLSSRGGSGSVTWSISMNGATWAAIDASGKITGTPDAAGYFYTAVSARDADAHEAVSVFEIWISAPLQFTATPTDAVRGYPYSWSGVIEGGKAPFTVTLASGSFPPGVTMSVPGNGISLSGTPDTLGTYTFTVHIRDSATTPQSIDVPLTLKVLKILKITSESLKVGVVGRAYADTVQYVNGTPPLNWTADSLPTNMTVDTSTGTVSGTPAEPHFRAYRFTVTDSDTPQQSDSRWVNFTIYDVLRVPTPSMTVTAHVNEYLYVPFTYTGGVPPVTVNPSFSTVVSGISFENGVLAGNPVAAGTWTGTLHYYDSAVPPQTVDQPITITVLPPLPVILNVPPSPVANEPYSYQMLVSKGTPPYKWSVAAGALPSGISLSQGGLLSGSTAIGGIYNFALKVTDSASPAQSSQVSVEFSVNPKALGRNDTIPTATPAEYSLGATLSPYDDPPGATAPDTDYYKLYATEGAEVTVEVRKYYSVSPIDPVLEIVDANGMRYQTCKDPADDSPAAPIAIDTTPSAFDDECLNDDVDLGVNTNSSLVFKVPGNTGKVATFYAHVLDLQGNARPDMHYILDFRGGLAPLNIIDLPNVQLTQGQSFGYQLTATGGSGTKTWSVISGSLPPGLTLSSSGVFSGVPTNLGYFVFTANVTDSSNPPMTANKTFGVRVVAP